MPCIILAEFFLLSKIIGEDCRYIRKDCKNNLTDEAMLICRHSRRKGGAENEHCRVKYVL